MNRTASQAMLAELAWKRGKADGEAALQGGGAALPGPPRILPADLRSLARQAGARGTPADRPGGLDSEAAWERAYELAGDAYACACARAARGEEQAVSQQVRYLPGWPLGTGSRSGYLAGPATLDGHPRVLFEDGSEETLPRAAITGAVVFLLEESTLSAVPAASGDIVVSPFRREALAVSAGMLVVPDPDLAGPGTPHAWTDLLTAALLDAHLRNGRPLESFAHAGFSAATAAREQAREPSPLPNHPRLRAGAFLAEGHNLRGETPVPDEQQQWKEREIALASGQPWKESRVVQVEGRLLDGAEAVESGRAVHCRPCSSPHQQIFHDAHGN